MKKHIAVVGTGYWGKNLVRNYYEIGALKTVCDTNPDALKRMKDAYKGIKTETNYSKVLSDKSIKGVVVALPAELHYPFAKDALEAGKDVYVEKPLALKLEHAEHLIKLAKDNNSILMVGHLLQYHPAFMKLKKMIEDGVLGRIQYIYSNRLSLGKIRREENSLWSFAPHDISMILSLCNEMPEEVYATGGNYLHESIADVTTTHLTFSSGIKSHIFVSWLHPFKEQKLIVVADKKMAVFEDTQDWDSKIKLYSHSIKWENGMPIPQKAEAECVAVDKSEPLRDECNHFLDCIKSRRQPITDGEEGFRVLKVLDMAQNSLMDKQSGKTTSTADVKDDYYVHETALVDKPCSIGKGTKIWHFSHVMKNCSIGKKSILGQNVNIASDVKIGNNVKIQNNVSIYTGTSIEDDVFLGPSCVLTNVSNPRSQIVRHDLYEKIIIKRGASVGANATIVCGVEIGRYAFIGAGAVVTKDVPDYALMVGNPAKQTGWMSRHGHKLSKPNKAGVMVCPESGLKYKLDKKKKVLKCIDLDENKSLPLKLSKSVKSYREIKTKNKGSKK